MLRFELTPLKVQNDLCCNHVTVIIQNAGAAALVVVDNGSCRGYDQRCLPGATKARREGFGAMDVKAHWYVRDQSKIFTSTSLFNIILLLLAHQREYVRIPVYFILVEEAKKLSGSVDITFSRLLGLHQSTKAEL